MTNTFQSWEKMCCNITPLFKLYNMLYSKVVKKEIFLGSLSKNDVILNIGCGAIPFTAVHLSSIIGAKVIAVDKDEEAIEKASYTLEKHNLADNIEFVKADASEFAPVSFTASIVALQVEPKEKILDNLLSHGENGARIIFRQPRDVFKTQYDYISKAYPPDAVVSQSMKTIDKSILYIKK
ncbi:class I SAM-dependent methyltransferase [Natranaerofaba carboxydovora]|uniref:class I SAM-dependent methyltransferase n=1 Tax=Natranaerofaba carboxydovora TaxID=2742683 RepID=UPI001F12D608|nr:class I SAM-dependent methyltransferase [Natranaerofaba carboxydovora]